MHYPVAGGVRPLPAEPHRALIHPMPKVPIDSSSPHAAPRGKAGNEADRDRLGKPRTQSRSEQRRGPKAAVERDVLSEQVRRAAAPYAGLGADDADRHLAKHCDQFREGTEDDVYFRATRAIVVAARRWRKMANDRVKAVGQTMARWETLFLVAYSGQDLSQGELARLISVEGPTMVRMLDILARDGLIERRQSETDRRVTFNSITPKGRTVISDIMAITNTLRAELLHDIEPEKLAVTLETLSLILCRLDEMR
jgi:MarR family transcriptional regulator for hemolysin